MRKTVGEILLEELEGDEIYQEAIRTLPAAILSRPGGLEAVKRALREKGIGTFEAKIYAGEMCSYDCVAYNDTWKLGCSAMFSSKMDKPGPRCPATLRAEREKALAAELAKGGKP